MNSPELWLKLLNEAPKGSVLMGGAIVDFMLGIEPKDYDIFHHYQPGMPEVPNYWKFIEMDYNDPVKIAEHQADYGPLGNGNPIGSVYNYDAGGLKVQMIGITYADPRDYFSKFDHTLTLGSFSENGLFVHSKVFESIITKTVTCTNDSRPLMSLARAQAKVARFDPSNFEFWAFEGFNNQGE